MQEDAKQQTKVCKRCGRELPVDQFGKHAKTKDGLQPICKECRSKKSKAAHVKKNVTPEVIEKLEELEDTVNSYAEKIKEEPVAGTRLWPNLSGFQDEDLIHELAERGWEGNISKRICVTYYISPEGIEIE